MPLRCASICSICIEECLPRGGRPLIINGCCGKTLHKDCLDSVIAQGGTTCPDCRATLPNLPSVQPPPPLARRPSRRSYMSTIGNVFGFGGFEGPRSNQTRSGISSPGYEDSLLPSPEPVANTTAAESEGIIVSVTNTPERKKISTAEHPLFYATVDVQYSNDSTIKTPLDIVCIVDVSGSMQGAKIQSLRKAVEFVISTLGDQDRLSLVQFNSDADVVHGLARMTESNKLEAKRLANGLHAGGGTNIYNGMQAGWDILCDRRESNGSTCVFLLTDGQDQQSEREGVRLASTMKEQGCSLMVFGFGADHDSRLMSAIANAAEGDFTYVDTPDTVIDAFGGAIGSQQGSSIKDVELTLQSRNGVKIKNVNAGIYSATISSNQSGSTTTFRQLYPGEKRTLLLQLFIPAVVRSGMLGLYGQATDISEQLIFTSTIRYTDGSMVTNKEPVECTISRLNEGFDDASRRIIAVDSHVNRCISTKATQDAMQRADNGDFSGARRIIEDALTQIRASSSFAVGNPIVTSSVEDLEEALRAVSNSMEYSRGGRAMCSEAYSKGSAQRSCYTKKGKSSHWQNTSSMTYQSAAFRSKGTMK